MNDVGDEDIMRGVRVRETEWKQSDFSMTWFKRYCVMSYDAPIGWNQGRHLFTGKVLGVEQWMSQAREYWCHVADVVAYKQLRAFLDDYMDKIGPNTVLAREYDALPLQSEPFAGSLPLQ